MMRFATAFAVALAATAAWVVLVYFYMRWESPYKARMLGLMIQLPTWVEWRIKVYDWIANFWYLIAAGLFVATFVITAVGMNRGDKASE